MANPVTAAEKQRQIRKKNKEEENTMKATSNKPREQIRRKGSQVNPGILLFHTAATVTLSTGKQKNALYNA